MVLVVLTLHVRPILLTCYCPEKGGLCQCCGCPQPIIKLVESFSFPVCLKLCLNIQRPETLDGQAHAAEVRWILQPFINKLL